jgi:general secretion pathway protein I
MGIDQISISRDSGFTLIEVIIAFLIAALSIATLFEAITGGIGSTANATKVTRAILFAESHIAIIGRGESISDNDVKGSDPDGYTWHVIVRTVSSRKLRYEGENTLSNARAAYAILYSVEVSETWEDGPRNRTVTLNTYRIDVRAKSKS